MSKGAHIGGRTPLLVRLLLVHFQFSLINPRTITHLRHADNQKAHPKKVKSVCSNAGRVSHGTRSGGRTPVLVRLRIICNSFSLHYSTAFFIYNT